MTPEAALEAFKALGAPTTLCALRHSGRRGAYWIRVATTDAALARVAEHLGPCSALAVFRGGELVSYSGGHQA